MKGGADHTVLVAAIAAATALVGAFIAAISADRRQRRQLEHEETHQRSQLKHEETRQRSQLKHDRDLKDLAELRSVLDEATVALRETIHHSQALFSRLSAPVQRTKTKP